MSHTFEATYGNAGTYAKINEPENDMYKVVVDSPRCAGNIMENQMTTLSEEG